MFSSQGLSSFGLMGVEQTGPIGLNLLTPCQILQIQAQMQFFISLIAEFSILRTSPLLVHQDKSVKPFPIARPNLSRLDFVQKMMQHPLKKFSVTWRGKKFVLDMNPDGNLKELGDELQRLTNVKPETMRLIVPTNKGSKLFYPLSDDHSHLALEGAQFLEGKSIRMMGVPENEVDELLQNSKVDQRIAGFDEEEKRLRSRISDGRNSLPQLPQGTYIFSEFRTLDIPGIQLNPPASEALKLMHRLAVDPGIVAIMTKHRWRVGIMTEMAPVGYVGVSPKCILGFNKNHGEEISLRLRTDELNGFRKYESIKKTLLHELAHMVYSEHDSNFYAFDKQLNEEVETLDWTKAKGYTLNGARHSFYYEGDLTNHISSPEKLGGQASAFSDARASSVAAAYRRFSNASNDVLRMPGIQEEPDSGMFTICQEPDHKHIEGKRETSLTYTGTVQKYPRMPDAPHNEVEPHPDSKGGEAMECEPCLHPGRNGTITEPLVDHSEVAVVPILITKASEERFPKNLCVSMEDRTVAEPESLGATERLENQDGLKAVSLEPDPDDSGLRTNVVDYKTKLRPDCDKGLFTKESRPDLSVTSSSREPVPDDSQVSTVVQPVAGRSDDITVCAKNMSIDEADEPDPDNMELQIIQDPVSTICDRLQKAIELLRSELNTLAATSILKTIIRILQNAMEHPDELKFRKLRKANPVIQRSIVSHRAAMEILFLIGFSEDVLVDGAGNGETYLILKRNDPGLLWLAKTSLESSIA